MNRRRNSHIGKRMLHLIALITLFTLVLSLIQTQVAQAATIDVPCNVTDLVNAINTANTNGEADTLNLAPACTYTLTSTLDILVDGGNPLTIEGNGATISGNNTVRVFFVNTDAILDLNAVTVSNGFTALSGGGIANGGFLTLTNSTLSNNSAGDAGGGIYLFNVGILTLTNSTLANNSAGGEGGGVYNLNGTLIINGSTVSSNAANVRGGGIYNTSSGIVSLNSSTVSGNAANNLGGGIYNLGTLTVTTTTFSGNAANNLGGGIYNLGTLTVTTTTFSGNSVYNFGGGSIYNGGGASIANSIIANSVASFDCVDAGTITPSGGNLVEDGLCGIAGALSGDPLLGGLTGSPAYFPLLPGSPAIDTGDNGVCPPTDQRGAARPFDGDDDGTATCDLGAYEVDTVITPAPPTPTSPYTATPTLDAPVATVPPPPDTPRCEDLNFVADGVVRASVSDALDYAVYCRVLYANGAPAQWLGGDLYNAGSIGHQGVIDLGVVQAVDVYSPVGMTTFDGGVVICLSGQGTLIFLAARNAPRIAEIISTYPVDDFTGFICATLFETGTLVLVRDNPQE